MFLFFCLAMKQKKNSMENNWTFMHQVWRRSFVTWWPVKSLFLINNLTIIMSIHNHSVFLFKKQVASFLVFYLFIFWKLPGFTRFYWKTALPIHWKWNGFWDTANTCCYAASGNARIAGTSVNEFWLPWCSHHVLWEHREQGAVITFGCHP